MYVDLLHHTQKMRELGQQFYLQEVFSIPDRQSNTLETPIPF